MRAKLRPTLLEVMPIKLRSFSGMERRSIYCTKNFLYFAGTAGCSASVSAGRLNRTKATTNKLPSRSRLNSRINTLEDHPPEKAILEGQQAEREHLDRLERHRALERAEQRQQHDRRDEERSEER